MYIAIISIIILLFLLLMSKIIIKIINKNNFLEEKKDTIIESYKNGLNNKEVENNNRFNLPNNPSNDDIVG